MNKQSAKNVRATEKKLRELARALAQNQPRARTKSNPNKSSSKKSPSQLKQIKSTTKASVKAIKTLTSVFRDAFGRFAAAPKSKSKKSTPKKSLAKKQTKAQPKTPLFTIPKAPVPRILTRKTPVKLAANRVRKNTSYTLADEKRAIKESLQNRVAETPKKSSKKVSMRSLKARKNETLLEFFDRIEADAEQLDRLKGKDDFWIFNYANGKSRKVYRNIDLAIKTMRRYDLSKDIIEDRKGNYEGEIERDTLDSIQFLKFGGTPLEYVVPNEERIRERQRERLKIRSQAFDVLGRVRGDKGFNGNIDLVARLLERQKEMEDEMMKMQASKKGRKKNANKTSGVSKAKSARKSRAAKKGVATPKNNKPAKGKGSSKTKSSKKKT